MPETPKSKRMLDQPDDNGRSNWSDDERERGYYYDDAHGYEKYEPENDEDGDKDAAKVGTPSSRRRRFDIDLDRAPTLLIEP